MRNESDVRKLLEEMTSFYKEHLPEESSYEDWLDTLVDIYIMLKKEVEYLDKTSLPRTTPTLRTIPYYEINLVEALYDKTTAKNLISMFDNDCKNLIFEMEKRGLYVDLDFFRVKSELPTVYSMDLYFEFDKNTKLELQHDYFIRRNKLFLLPEFILNNNRVLHVAHAYNIKVNDYTLEMNWGDNFPIRVPFLMARYKYRTFLEAYTRLMHSQYFIKDMKEAVSIVTENEGMDIFDIRSVDLPTQYKRLYEEYYLSPLDFIVRLDEEQLFDKIQINLILHMIMNTKQVETFFWLFFTLYRCDEMEAGDDNEVTIEIDSDDISKDEMEAEDCKDYGYVLEVEDEFFCNPYYDGKMRIYDIDDIPYDDEDDRCMELKMEGVWDDMYINMDESPNSVVYMDKKESIAYENFHINVIAHPEIPRGFNVSNNKITFSKNKGKTDSYEIYGSVDGKTFNLLDTIDHNDDGSETIEYSIDNAKKKNIRYYKIRSKERTHLSLYTLIKEEK